MRRAIALLLVFILCLSATPAWSWMAYTHVYLAEEALHSAESGHVTFRRVDPVSGTIGAPIGTYTVDPDMLAAIRSHRAVYHAGLIGPDGYPDLLTGQFLLHANYDGQGGTISDDWLQTLWRKSRGPLPKHAAEQAFVLGYLQHVAGDMFAHDCINWYTGGDYDLEHHNALKHINIEGYVQTVTPEVKDPGFYAVSTDDITKFMFDTLIDTPLLAGPGCRYSVPGWIEALRSLPFPVPSDVRQRLNHGLYQWPQLATQLAVATMFNPTRHIDWNGSDVAVHAYFETLGTMVTEDEMVGMYEKLKSLMPPGGKGELEWLRKIRKMGPGVTLEILHHMEQTEPEALGLVAILQDPAVAWDISVATKDATPDGQPSKYPDHPIKLADFRRDELHMTPTDTVYDYHRFRPAYNTFVACQMALLGPVELRRLVNDIRRLHGDGPLKGAFPPNVMLGFVQSVNGSQEWTHGMILDPASFRTVFMDEVHPRWDSPSPTASPTP